MYFITTRDKNTRKSASQAIRSGLAPDGGLFIPEYLPRVDLKKFTPDLSYPEFAAILLQEFFLDDELKDKLPELCNNAFTFPAPLTTINNNTYMLELFHGPTSSFKDFGARFLAECFNVLFEKNKATIIVATSGDTGSAVASAFYQKSNVNVIVLYPYGQITERQEHQIACWDTNILALAVDGTFDDCQHLVKSAFRDPWWQSHMHLSSANSISIGRLLPQIVYYAYSSLQFYRQHQTVPGYIVPTGNLGNATACYWAKEMGFPIREIVLATNANRAIPDYLHTGEFHPRPSISTLANAMDVGNPSNFERLLHLFNTYDEFKKNVRAISADDEDIKVTIKEMFQDYHTIVCPHTATAFHARKQLSELPWIAVATADASKFSTIIEPIIKTDIPISPQLQALLDRPVRIIKVTNTLEDIQATLTHYWDTY